MIEEGVILVYNLSTWILLEHHDGYLDRHVFLLISKLGHNLQKLFRFVHGLHCCDQIASEHTTVRVEDWKLLAWLLARVLVVQAAVAAVGVVG